MRRKANLNHVNPQRPLILKNATREEMDALQDLAHKVLANPTKLTSKYLERLVIFLKFKFSEFAQLKIVYVHKLQSHYKQTDIA